MNKLNKIQQAIEWLAHNAGLDSKEENELAALVPVALVAFMLDRECMDIAFRLAQYNRYGVHNTSTVKYGR